jgi:hypothetical protein
MEENSDIPIPNPEEISQVVNDIESSIPETEQEIPAETIEILNKNVISNLKPQENKYWHFSFKNEANKNGLTQTLQNIPGYNLTVEYGIPQNTPDITLKINDNIVGKIHLLLCDRRDANLPEKYYCKIYFYHFTRPELYQVVKTAVINFFENFKASENKIGGKFKKIYKKTKIHKTHKTHKTHKKRHLNRRKKTAKRT